jgi:drug/metabolite transporter (DMT)-like permease
MIAGILVFLAIVAGIVALVCAAVSGIALERDRRSDALFTGWLGVGFLAAALVLMWWAK